MEHKSFMIASIPFLARFARSFRAGENVSLVVKKTPRYLYMGRERGGGERARASEREREGEGRERERVSR